MDNRSEKEDKVHKAFNKAVADIQAISEDEFQQLIDKYSNHKDTPDDHSTFDINMKDESGLTLLFWAIHHSRYDLVDILLKHPKINPSTEIPEDYQHPLQVAIRRKNDPSCEGKILKENDQLLNALLDHHKIDINQCGAGYNGRTALMEAARGGNPEIVELLLNKKADVNQANSFKNTALMEAARGGNLETVKLLLNKQANVNQTNDFQDTALIEAVRQGNPKTVELLLNKQADVNQANSHGDTALMEAARDGNPKTVELLLNKKADVNHANIHGDTALHKTVERMISFLQTIPLGFALAELGERRGFKARPDEKVRSDKDIERIFHEEVLQVFNMLCRYNADAFKKGSNDRTPLDMIVEYYKLPGCEGVLKKISHQIISTWLNSKVNTLGHTPLLFAAKNNNLDIFEWLYDEENTDLVNASLKIDRDQSEEEEQTTDNLLKNYIEKTKDTDGHTALHLAAAGGNLDVVEFLLKKGIDPDLSDTNGETPLDRASNDEVVQLLLSYKLLKAAEGGDHDCFEQLLAQGANPNIKNNDGNTPLHIAVENERLDFVEELLNHAEFNAGDIDCVNENGDTALHIAAKKSNNDFFKLLLKHKADINAQDNDHHTALYIAVDNSLFNDVTALHLAADSGNLDSLIFLLNKKIDTDLSDNKGNTPLHIAVENGYVNVVEKLLKNKAFNTDHINDVNENGDTALHKAAQTGDLASLKLLLQKGAIVNARDSEDNTPLHIAVENGHANVVEELLKQEGINILAINKWERVVSKEDTVFDMLNTVEGSSESDNQSQILELLHNKMIEDIKSSSETWHKRDFFGNNFHKYYFSGGLGTTIYSMIQFQTDRDCDYIVKEIDTLFHELNDYATAPGFKFHGYGKHNQAEANSFLDMLNNNKLSVHSIIQIIVALKTYMQNNRKKLDGTFYPLLTKIEKKLRTLNPKPNEDGPRFIDNIASGLESLKTNNESLPSTSGIFSGAGDPANTAGSSLENTLVS